MEQNSDLDANYVEERSMPGANDHDHTMQAAVGSPSSSAYNYDAYFSSLVDRFGSIPEAESFFTEYDAEIDTPLLSSEDEDDLSESVNSNSTDDQADDQLEENIYALPHHVNSSTTASFNSNEEKFKKACHDLMDLSSEFVENDKMGEQEYIDMCNTMKVLFKSHESMMKTIIKINNQLSAKLKESSDKIIDLCAELDELKSPYVPPTPTITRSRGFFKKLMRIG